MSIALKPMSNGSYKDEEKGDAKHAEDHTLLNEDHEYDDEDDLSDLEYVGELPQQMQPQTFNYRLWIAIAVNATSTIAIVFVNKSIFSVPAWQSLRNAQVSFAAFHFTITALVLYLLSRPRIGVFEAKRVDVTAVLPLSSAMILNVVLQNAALANSSIQFNQVARVLLTPACAALNFLAYRQTMSWRALLTLLPICVGVAVVSYFDTKPAGTAATAKDTTPIGVVFALAGVCASAMYTVWVKPFHAKLECNTFQLLLNQSAVSVGIMLYIIPFSDDRAVWLRMEGWTWGLVLLSGFLAALINISMFFVIHDAGPVSSTVVGHLKTCSIILLGWITSQKSLKDASMIGFVMAIGGIIAYSYITHRERAKS